MKLNSELNELEEEIDDTQQNIKKIQDEIRLGLDEDNNRRKLADLTAKESVLAVKIENRQTDLNLLGRIINESRKQLCKLQDDIFFNELVSD